MPTARVDDSRRLTTQDEAIERLEHSVQAYQDERGRLESAYRQLASSLGETGARLDERLSHATSPGPQEKAAPHRRTDRGEQDRCRPGSSAVETRTTPCAGSAVALD